MSNNAFYMLYVEGGNSPTATHMSRIEAYAEAERLARKTLKRVYILKGIEIVEVSEAPIKRTELE
jgi:hypothetical protein